MPNQESLPEKIHQPPLEETSALPSAEIMARQLIEMLNTDDAVNKLLPIGPEGHRPLISTAPDSFPTGDRGYIVGKTLLPMGNRITVANPTYEGKPIELNVWFFNPPGDFEKTSKIRPKLYLVSRDHGRLNPERNRSELSILRQTFPTDPASGSSFATWTENRAMIHTDDAYWLKEFTPQDTQHHHELLPKIAATVAKELAPSQKVFQNDPQTNLSIIRDALQK